MYVNIRRAIVFPGLATEQSLVAASWWWIVYHHKVPICHMFGDSSANYFY